MKEGPQGTRRGLVESERDERRGVVASPGICVGDAYLVDRRKVHVPRRHIPKSEVAGEVKRFRQTVRRASEQLEEIKGRLSHGEHRQILKAQQLMLRDPDLLHQVEAHISKESINADWAVSKTVDELRETLSKVTDEYFRERLFDFEFIGERLLRTLQGKQSGEIQPPKGAVVIAHELSPADMAQLHNRGIGGIVTEVGGQTSHTAIMARAFEIPAVVGVEGVLQDVESTQSVVVDGVRGRVITRPTAEEVVEFEAEARRYREFEARVQKEHGLPAMTKDGHRVVLRANIAFEEELPSSVFYGAEGVGLFRTEFIYLNRDDAPTEEEHYRKAKAALQRASPYPVVFRTFDLGADKPCRLFPANEDEANPAMGLRSLRLSLRQEDHFLAQLRGLLRAALHGPVRIMFPLVGSLTEIQAGKRMLAKAKEQLEKQRVAHSDEVLVGAMIEVPGAALIADVLAQHVDFMSIGTNDLIQYTLAIDRENDEVNYLYQPLHPAILRLIRNVSKAGEAAGIPVSVCGEMASDPTFSWVLIGLGIRELSVHPGAVPVIKNLIRCSDLSDIRQLAKAIAECSTAEEAKRVTLEAMRARFPEHLLHGAGGSSQDDSELN